MGSINNIFGGSTVSVLDNNWRDEEIPDPNKVEDNPRVKILGNPYSPEYESLLSNPDIKIEKRDGISKKEMTTLLNRAFPPYSVAPGYDPRSKQKKINKWFYTEEEKARPFAIPESLAPLAATAEQLARLKALQNLPIIKNDKTFEAIMAVPVIAEAEAKRCWQEKDKKGYRHLAALMRYYLLSQSNGPRPERYMMNIGFPLEFRRFKSALKRFIDPHNPGNIINDKALRSIYSIMDREGYLEGEGKELKASEMDPRLWEKF